MRTPAGRSGAVPAALAILLAACVCNQPVNLPPDTPAAPVGPTTGGIDSAYTFTASATDPDGDSVALRFSWGDGDTSDWSEFVAPGGTVAASHAWSDSGNYEVRAQARDNDDSLSGWSDPPALAVGRAGVGPWVLSSIHVIDAPLYGIAVSPDARYVYVSSHWGEVARIWKLDVAGCSVLASVYPWDTGPESYHRSMALSPDGNRLFFDYFDWAIGVLRTSDLAITDTAPTEYYRTDGMVLTSAGDFLYALYDPVLRVFDAETMLEVDSLVLGQPCDRNGWLDASPDGEYIYCLLDDALYAVRTRDRTVTARVSYPAHNHGGIAGDNSGMVYVCADDGNAWDVTVVDTRIGTIVGGVELPWMAEYRSIWDCGLSPDGARLYVLAHEATYQAPDLSVLFVIKTGTRSVVNTVRWRASPSQPNGAYSLAVSRTGTRLFAACNDYVTVLGY